MANELPAGFQLDQQPQSLPEGFQVDAQQATPELTNRQIIQQNLGGADPLAFPKQIKGIGEAISSIGSSVFSRPISGLAGLAETVTGDAQAGAEEVARQQALLTPDLSPEGQQVLQDIGGGLESLMQLPGIDKVIELSKNTQDFVTKVGEITGQSVAGETGRQIGGAIGRGTPQALIEGAGIRASLLPRGQTLSSFTSANKANLPKTPSKREIRRLSFEAAPDVGQLKQAARSIYKNIDDLGVTVRPQATDKLFDDIAKSVRSEGFSAAIHPKVAGVLGELENVKGQALNVSEIDTLRKVARSAARSIEPEEARLGSIIMSKIDEGLDNLKQTQLLNGQGAEVGGLYRQARNLWGRARRSELIDESFEKARNQASGFENGIRVQFRSILNNKKKLKGFKPQEIKAMQRVVRGGGAENTAKALGKFGFTEGQASTMLLGSAGVAGGAALGGAPGAVIVPLIGQVSKNLAQKMTRNNAEFANALVRSGDNSSDIIKAYYKHVPKAERNTADLTELLLGKTKLPSGRKVKGLTSEQNQAIKDIAFINKSLTEQEIKRVLGLAALSANTTEGQ